MSSTSKNMNRGPNEETERYIRFSLGREEYAIPLLKVREVIAMPETTPVPQTPQYFLGIMNLRGQVITVLDLRLKLGIKADRGAEMAVIIVDLGEICVGVVVDSINSVLAAEQSDLAERPDLKQNRAAEYITGVYRKEKGLVLLLDIARLLSFEDHGAISSVSGKAA
jgi:purine-binding chemotaxis protein CheW